MKFIIEICEKKLSKWLLIELRFSKEIAGENNLLLTNVKNNEMYYLLKNEFNISRKSILEMKEIHDKIIILDPLAKKRLKPEEAKQYILVIGGILGDHPPQNRTYKLLTSKIPNVKSRNLGKKQFSIDGALYIAKKVSEGYEISNIPIIDNIEITIDNFHKIILPYRYPLVDNKPLISEELINYLKYEIEEEEEILIKSFK